MNNLVVLAGFFQAQDIKIIAIVAVAFILLVVLGMKANKPKKKDPEKEKRKIKTYERIYSILVNNRLLKSYIISATKKYGTLSVFSQSEIKCLIVKSLRNTIFGSAVTFALAAIAFREWSAALLCLYGAVVVFSIAADKNIEKATTAVYKEVKVFMSSLRIEFKKSKGDILVALENAQCGRRIARVVDEIKQVLVSPNMEQALEKFYQRTPFKQLQTLAMVCSNIYMHGDMKSSGDESVFDESMLLMEADVNQKLEQISYEKQLYKLQILNYDAGLEALAFIGIVMTIVLKIIMVKVTPSVQTLYNSIVGFLIQDGSIAFSIFAYNKVARAHLQSVVLPDDRLSPVVRLMEKERVQKFIHTIAPVDRKRRILEYKLKVSVSKHTVDSFWCEKCYLAAIAFTFVLAMSFTTPLFEKSFLTNYTKGFDMMSDNSAYEDKDGNELYTKKDILELDEYYINCRKAGLWELMDDYDKVEIKELLLSYMPTLSTMQIEDQMSRLETKYQKLKNVKYRWWYVLLALAAGGGAFWYPTKKLKDRLELAKAEEEEEFLQIQMITLILSSLNMDTFDTLGHLTNISEFHKKELARAYYGYASDPEGELQRLEDSIRSVNFKLFVGKLKETIENLSVKEVFADLRNDRVHICNERDAIIKNNIYRKRAKMGRVAIMPMNVSIYAIMVFPLLYTGITGLMSSLSSISEL